MGADMMIIAARQPHPSSELGEIADFDFTIRELFKLRIDAISAELAIAALTDEPTIEAAAEDLSCRDIGCTDTSCNRHLTEHDHDLLAQWVRSRVDMNLGTFCKGVRREVSDCNFPGPGPEAAANWFWVTGGLSFGDMPTDDGYALATIAFFGLFEAPITVAEYAAAIALLDNAEAQA